MGRIAVLVSLALLCALAWGCGDEEEAAPPTDNPSATSVSSPTSTATVQPTPPVPDGWEVYTDPQLGFSFPHPGGLTHKEEVIPLSEKGRVPATELRIVSLSRSDNVPVVGVSVTANPASLSRDEWIREVAGWPCEPGASPTCDPVEVVVGGEPGIRFSLSGLGEPAANIYFAHAGFIFALGANVHGSGEGRYGPAITEEEFDAVIRGFRFRQS